MYREDYGRGRRLMLMIQCGLWVKMWELGVRGKMWIVIKEMYLGYLMGNVFDVQQGVAQGCSLSPIL